MFLVNVTSIFMTWMMDDKVNSIKTLRLRTMTYLLLETQKYQIVRAQRLGNQMLKPKNDKSTNHVYEQNLKC